MQQDRSGRDPRRTGGWETAIQFDEVDAMADRIHCLVPGCRRTCKADGTFREWICGKHWSGVPKRLRRRKNLVSRMIRREAARNPLFREYWRMSPGSPERIKATRIWRLSDAIWERCKRAAIEESFLGLTI